MGLDTSHDCWHGPYSSFMRWRQWINLFVMMDRAEADPVTPGRLSSLASCKASVKIGPEYSVGAARCLTHGRKRDTTPPRGGR